MRALEGLMDEAAGAVRPTKLSDQHQEPCHHVNLYPNLAGSSGHAAMLLSAPSPPAVSRGRCH
jgi:hypothetical protein